MYENNKQNDNATGFKGTEFKYPILYAVKGVTSPSELREEDRHISKSTQHIDELWMTELEEAKEPDRDNYFITDDSFRSLCVGLNEGSNGWALLMNLDASQVEGITSRLNSRKLNAFAYGETASILRKAGIPFIDLGPRESGAIYFAQLLVRYALIYARDLGGDPHEVSHSIEEYAPGVTLLFREPSDESIRFTQGLLGLGVPVISCAGDLGLVGHIHCVESLNEMMDIAWNLPNIRARFVTHASPDLPVLSGPIYRRETLKEGEIAVNLEGSENSFMVCRPGNILHDKVHVKGQLSTASGFSLLVELGNPMAEPTITLWVEAIIKRVSKYAKGVKIQSRGGGRVMLQMTKEAQESGVTLNHIGEMIITELRNEFSEIGPVEVSFFLDKETEERLRPEVDAYKDKRKKLIESASEDTIDTFYGCTRCRSFSLGHACTVTPDRPAQCSKPWYMLKAYAVLSPGDTYNPCTLIEKGECVDSVKGEYQGVNASTNTRTNGMVDRVYLHSIFGYPHTACSCFQNVVYYIPEVDGIAIMDRGYEGEAPGGMTWTRLANLVAGRQYPDGAASIATHYLRSPKFLQADGGYKKVVWMTETLKNFALESIPSEHRSRIQTEKNVTTLDELILSQKL